MLERVSFRSFSAAARVGFAAIAIIPLASAVAGCNANLARLLSASADTAAVADSSNGHFRTPDDVEPGDEIEETMSPADNEEEDDPAMDVIPELDASAPPDADESSTPSTDFEVPEVPDVPSVPDIPGVPDLPIPQLPEIPELPDSDNP